MTDGTKVTLKLEGVPGTLLWPLYNRAAEARRPNALLHNPLAVKLADTIAYPFEKHFGRPDECHVLRALRFDEQLRLYIKDFPDCTVVALGDGLETEFWRVDNGRIKWLVVDLPETIAARRQVLPETDRQRYLTCSALDFRWMKEVDPSHGVFVTAQGILMYFEPSEVRGLIAECASRFGGGRMMFDLIPRWFSQNTLTGYQTTRSYTTPRMPFGMDVNEIPTIQSYHPNILEAKEVEYGRGRGFHYGYAMPVRRLIPGVRNRRSSFVLLRFGPDAAGGV